MTEQMAIESKIVELIDRLEAHLPGLRNLEFKEPARFADVILLARGMANPDEGHYVEKRPVETSFPAVFAWLFREFAKIGSSLPDYGFLKEEIFGRLGNTIKKTGESELNLTLEARISYLVQDFWEISQDILEGKFNAFEVAPGASIYDDYLTRALKSEVVVNFSFLGDSSGGDK